MPLTPERRANLLTNSKDAAAAFLEDMRYLREIIAKPPPERAELRRMSGILRRLLIDGDLKRVAAPRISPLVVREPDNQSAYEQLAHNPKGFFGSAGINLGAIIVGGFTLVSGTLSSPPPRSAPSSYLDNTVEVGIDNFLAQRVLYLSGSWVTRRTVIKYVANIASGVHSSGAQTKDEMVLEDIRRGIFYVFLLPTGLAVRFRSAFFTLNPADFRYGDSEVDPTLIELHAAAHMLTISPSIEELERIIAAEIKTA